MSEELSLLLSGMYTDSQGNFVATNKCHLEAGINKVLHQYAAENWDDFFSGGTKREFTTPESDSIYQSAKTCKWWECFSSTELQNITDFCAKKGLNGVK